MRKYFAAIAMALSLTACGGGDDSSPAYLAGTYSATLNKSIDNCGIFTSYNGANHVITVDGAIVTAQINSLVMKGGVSEDGGLRATYEVTNNNVTTRSTLVYSTPANQSPQSGTFNASLTIEGISGGFICRVKLEGAVTKIG